MWRAWICSCRQEDNWALVGLAITQLFNLSELFFFFFVMRTGNPPHIVKRSRAQCAAEMKEKIDFGITFNPDQLLTAPPLSQDQGCNSICKGEKLCGRQSTRELLFKILRCNLGILAQDLQQPSWRKSTPILTENKFIQSDIHSGVRDERLMIN